MNKQLHFLFAAFACIILASSCASLTGFEEGRSLEEGASELTISGNFTRVPDLFDDENSGGLDTLDSSISFPNLEFTYKRGLSDKLDVGARVSTNLNASSFVKYQVVGDQSSSFALSPGIEVGTVLGLAYNVGVPIYATYYPAEAVAVNITPRVMYQFVTGDESSGVTYLGGNFGLLFGKKNKFGLDIGYYNVGTGEGNSETLLTFGIGGKFKFGDFEASSGSDIDDGGSTRKRGRGRR